MKSINDLRQMGGGRIQEEVRAYTGGRRAARARHVARFVKRATVRSLRRMPLDCDPSDCSSDLPTEPTIVPPRPFAARLFENGIPRSWVAAAARGA